MKYKTDIIDAFKCARDGDPGLLQCLVQPSLPERDKVVHIFDTIGDPVVIERVRYLEQRIATAAALVAYGVWWFNQDSEGVKISDDSIVAVRHLRTAMYEFKDIQPEKVKDVSPS